MITFKREMDAHSLTLERDGKRIGYLHWHPDRSPRVVLRAGPGASNELTVDEMRQCVTRYEQERNAQAVMSATMPQIVADLERSMNEARHLPAAKDSADDLTVHLLYAGQALCGFSTLVPALWPAGHAFVTILERGPENCPGCITEAGRRALPQ